MKEQHFKKISYKFHKKILKIEPLRAGFRRPLEKSILAVTRITRDNFIRNRKITYVLLVDKYSSWLDKGFFFKLKFEFLAKLYAKQYNFR